MITHLCGRPLSRATIIALARAEAEERRELAALQAEAEERRERAEGMARQYYMQHGEWEWETRAREADLAYRAEVRRDEKRREQAAEAHRAQLAALVMSGYRPRSHEEIVAGWRMAP